MNDSLVFQAAVWSWLQEGGTNFGSDVWWQEPAIGTMAQAGLPVSASAARPFETLPNVVMTPHCGGGMGLEQVRLAVLGGKQFAGDRHLRTCRALLHAAPCPHAET